MITVLNEGGQLELDRSQARAEGDALWLSDKTVTAVSGWTLKPEGLCQGDICVPVPRQDAAHFVADGQTNIAAFWRLLGRPVLHDDSGAHWLLGASAGERAATLASLTAPDFELPDIDGQLHRLSDYRGQRVFLTTWSSW
jgi:hypothetical protein